MIFNNPEFGKIRTIKDDGKVLFCGKDSAAALGYKRPNDAISAHCRGTVKRRIIDSIGREQEMLFIPEGDIYRLAAKSELPGADKFESWIFDEVLPSIRKHGLYAVDQLIENPDLAIQAFSALKEEREKRKALETELDRSKEWYSIKRVAHLNGVSHKAFDWRKLKIESQRQGYGVKKIFDANYGTINVYHMNVWEKVYPLMEL